MTDDDTPEAEAKSRAYSADDLSKLGQKWLERIRAAEKRESDWIKDAEAADRAFTHDDRTNGDGRIYEFNIFHSNIATIAPALYNTTPTPDVRERFRTGRQMDPASYEAAQVIERAILVQIDDGRLDEEQEAAVQDALIAGRGVMRLRFNADEEEVPGEPLVDEMTGEPMVDAETGEPAMSDPQTVMVNERIEFEVVSWRDYREGPALRWKDVPWVAFRHSIPAEEVERLRDPELKEVLSDGGTGEPLADAGEGADTKVWEIWCKETRRVYMIVAHSGDVMSITDDPMELKGFFPMPAPIQPITSAGRRMPVVPFKIYRALADELEDATRRIRAITAGLKLRGLVAGDGADIAQLAEAEDNQLVPIANLEGLVAVGGLDKAISWWPVDKAIQVLRELYQNREATKQMIYEITGISDIVRGSTKANETATAQQIKAEWGGLRIQRSQKMVERQVRDIFVICAELIASKFSLETLQRIAATQISPGAAEILTKPLDHYRIDVESDSTIQAGLARRKAEIVEFLDATGKFFSTVQPITEANPQLAGPFGEIYAAFSRSLSMGKQAQDAVEDIAQASREAAQQALQMMEQQRQAAEQAQQAEAQAAEREQAREDAKVQLDGQRVQIEGQKVAVMAQRQMMGV